MLKKTISTLMIATIFSGNVSARCTNEDEFYSGSEFQTRSSTLTCEKKCKNLEWRILELGKEIESIKDQSKKTIDAAKKSSEVYSSLSVFSLLSVIFIDILRIGREKEKSNKLAVLNFASDQIASVAKFTIISVAMNKLEERIKSNVDSILSGIYFLAVFPLNNIFVDRLKDIFTSEGAIRKAVTVASGGALYYALNADLVSAEDKTKEK